MRGICYSGIYPAQTDLISYEKNNEQKGRERLFLFFWQLANEFISKDT